MSFSSLLRIVLEGKSARRFFWGATSSLAFSVAVILSTVGLMDGFEHTLIESLRKSSSHVVLDKRGQRPEQNQQLIERLQTDSEVLAYAKVLSAQSFVVLDNMSKAIQVHGIDASEFAKVSSLKIGKLDYGEVYVGVELAKFYKLKRGDEVLLIFSKAKSPVPIYEGFVVKGFVDHGVYEKDLRFLYMSKLQLASIQGLASDAFSRIQLTLADQGRESIAAKVESLQELLPGFRVRAFWEEFGNLLDAVRVEKVSITLILQLIVIVSVFNIFAFVSFVIENQARSFFLLSALGLKKRDFNRFWVKLFALLLIISCLVGGVLTLLFDVLLQNLSVFQLPGDIYVLSQLSLQLTVKDCLIVFGISALWIFLVGFFSLWKLNRKSTLRGLRQEFN